MARSFRDQTRASSQQTRHYHRAEHIFLPGESVDPLDQTSGEVGDDPDSIRPPRLLPHRSHGSEIAAHAAFFKGNSSALDESFASAVTKSEMMASGGTLPSCGRPSPLPAWTWIETQRRRTAF